MSRKSYSSSVGSFSPAYMAGTLLYDYQIKNIEGKLLTLIESFGFPESRENSVKSLAREIIYDMYKGMYVSAEFSEKIHEDQKNYIIGSSPSIPKPSVSKK